MKFSDDKIHYNFSQENPKINKCVRKIFWGLGHFKGKYLNFCNNCKNSIFSIFLYLLRTMVQIFSTFNKVLHNTETSIIHQMKAYEMSITTYIHDVFHQCAVLTLLAILFHD